MTKTSKFSEFGTKMTKEFNFCTFLLEIFQYFQQNLTSDEVD